MYKILIVDDSRVLRAMLINHILEADGNIKESDIKEASDGAEGIALLEKENFDIVLSDINMPNMDGVTFAKKALEANRDLKIIIMTSRTSAEQKKELEEAGVTMLLHKPITKETVKKVVIVSLRESFAKHILQELQIDVKDLLNQLVEKFFYDDFNFAEIDNHKFETKHTELFQQSFEKTLKDQLKEDKAYILSEYFANKYTYKLCEILSGIFIYELGKENTNVQKFLSFYTGGIKAVGNEKYKIPSILDKEGNQISQSSMMIVATQYAKQTHMLKVASQQCEAIKKDITKIEGTIKEEESNVQKDADGDELVGENQKSIKAQKSLLEDKIVQLKQGEERLKKQSKIYTDYKPRYKMLEEAITKVLLAKKEKVEFSS